MLAFMIQILLSCSPQQLNYILVCHSYIFGKADKAHTASQSTI